MFTFGLGVVSGRVIDAGIFFFGVSFKVCNAILDCVFLCFLHVQFAQKRDRRIYVDVKLDNT